MVVRFEQILERIRGIEREIGELQRLQSRLPRDRPYSADIQLAYDRTINQLLNERIQLEELEIESPPEDLVADIVAVDLATASRIRADQLSVVAEPTTQEEQLLSYLRSLPKTEIHLHIEACISRDTLIGMLEQNSREFEPEKIDKLYKFSNLKEFVDLFLFILDSIVSPDDFNLIFNNVRSYMEHNNIRYAETFFAPSRMIQNGLDFKEIAQTLDRLSRECRLEGGPDIRYLVDVSRTFGPENASKNLQRVLEARTESIIGIGLGGAELMGPARDFKDVFAQARAEGLHAVAHSGEDDGPWSIWDTVEELKAERIGHGISAIQDPQLLAMLREREIPIEICLTSNIFTGKYVREEKNHPVRRYYDEGLVLSVNTDDPEIFNVDLTQEYFKLHKHLNFTISELEDLIRQGVLASFHPQPARLWREFRKEIDRLRKEHSM